MNRPETPTATEPSLGYVKEGQNYFFAFLDLNGSGIWDAGEPCGVSDTHSVDIGYDRNIVNIEMTDYTPGFLRISYATDDESLRAGLVRIGEAIGGLATARG